MGICIWNGNHKFFEFDSAKVIFFISSYLTLYWWFTNISSYLTLYWWFTNKRHEMRVNPEYWFVAFLPSHLSFKIV